MRGTVSAGESAASVRLSARVCPRSDDGNFHEFGSAGGFQARLQALRLRGENQGERARAWSGGKHLGGEAQGAGERTFLGLGRAHAEGGDDFGRELQAVTFLEGGAGAPFSRFGVFTVLAVAGFVVVVLVFSAASDERERTGEKNESGGVHGVISTGLSSRPVSCRSFRPAARASPCVASKASTASR